MLERIKRSAEYFSTSIEAALSKAIGLTTEVKSNNKQAVKRLKETYSDLHNLYRFHILLLKVIAEKGFTAATYLNEKQRSLVVAMDIPPKSTRPRREKKENKPKEEKEKTYVTSYKLYINGMSITDIAAPPSLMPSTAKL